MNPPNRASIVMTRLPAVVFAFIADIDRLSAWNDLITNTVHVELSIDGG